MTANRNPLLGGRALPGRAAGLAPALGTTQAPKGIVDLLADWDLVVLIVLQLADIRVFEGSSIASFTLYELFVWTYCAPYVIGRLLGAQRPLPAASFAFATPVFCYLAWVMLASAFALVARGHSDVLQQAKNIMPTLPFVCFLGMRIKHTHSVARIANIYVLYCVANCVLAIVQLKTGGPYFRPEMVNNEYKLDFSGNVVDNVVLGFCNTPNELALVVMPGVMFSAVKLLAEMRQSMRPRLVTLGCLLATALALWLSQSRGALVWAAVGLAAVGGPLRFNRSFMLKLLLVAFVIAAVVGYGLSAAHSVGDVENTVEVRVQLWKTAWAALIGDPYAMVLGDGGPYVDYWSWQTAGWSFPDAHNGWIDQALFFGVPALLLYLLIWRRFFLIVDPAEYGGVPCTAGALLGSIRGSVTALMGLSFFEPVAHSVFPVSQLFLLMSCGVCLAQNICHSSVGAYTKTP